MDRFGNTPADFTALAQLTDQMVKVRNSADAQQGAGHKASLGDMLKSLRNAVLNGGFRLPIVNNTGGTIYAWTLVSISGYDAVTGRFKVVKATNATFVPAHGVTTEDVLNNGTSEVFYNALCQVPTTVNARGLDSTGATVGDPVYLGTAGNLTLTEPDSTLYLSQRIGAVDRKTVKQVLTLTISGAFTDGASVTGKVGTESVAAVVWNATSDTTLADLATAIQGKTGVLTATVTAVADATNNDRVIVVTMDPNYKLDLTGFVDANATAPVTFAVAETTPAVFGDVRVHIKDTWTPSALKAYISAVQTSQPAKNPVQHVSIAAVAVVGAAGTGPTGLTNAGVNNGVAITAGDRVLLTAQASSIGNGIWVAAAGAWARAADFDATAEVKSGMLVPVDTTDWAQPDSVWIVTSVASAVVGTNNLTFARVTFLSFGTAPSTQAAGDAAAAGTSNKVAREDHKHAMPATYPPVIGAGAGDAVAGNDARLTDTRTPTNASVTHAKKKLQAIVALGDANAVLTAAQVCDSGLFKITLAAADRVLTLDTAAAIVAATPGAVVGTCVDISIVSLDAAAQKVTLALGTGITMLGKVDVEAMSSRSGTWRLRFDNVTALAEAITALRIA